MGSALSVRRAAVIAAPALAGLLIVAGFFLDPAIGESGRELAEEYAVIAIPAVALIVAVRGRGAWLANLAAFSGFSA